MIDFNRKDCTPEETIYKITSILKKMNIELELVSEHNVADEWFSVNIGIKGIPALFTNGKGISPNYAMASALGEMMERIQTGILLDNNYIFKIEKKINSYNDVVKIYKTFFSEYFKSISMEQITQFLMCNSRYGILEKYIECKSKKEVLLPEYFLIDVCGSNGCCAGNTEDEALTQGLGEVYERWVKKIIFFNEDYNEYSDIPITWIENLESYKMLKVLSNEGFSFQVKDLTLDGKFPVLGLIVYNQSRTKYRFSMASDINLDICLQRCITEMFQGLNLDVNFRMSMEKILDENTLDKRKWDSISKNEYVKHVMYGVGKIPVSLLFSKKSKNYELKPFKNDVIDNKLSKKYLMEIADKMGWKVYVRNCNYLGFPSYRIYIPKVTDIYTLDYEEGVQNIIDVNGLKNEIVDKKIDYDKILELIYKVLKLPKYQEDLTDIYSFMGIIVTEKATKTINDLKNESLFFQKRYQDIIDSMPEIVGTGNNNDLKKVYLYYKNNDITSNVYKRIMNNVNAKEENLFNKLELPVCPNCSECLLKNNCKYEEWLRLKKKVSAHTQLARERK